MAKKKTIAFLGAGKVAKVLGRLIAAKKSEDYEVTCLYNRTLENAQATKEFIGLKKLILVERVEDLPSTDFVFLLLSDDVIASYAQRPTLSPQTIVCHFSGCHNSHILKNEKYPTRVASLHLAKSFSMPELVLESFDPTYGVIEGDQVAVEELRKLLSPDLGIHLALIAAEDKIRYHLGLIYASNFLLALHQLAIKNLLLAHLPAENAERIVDSLMQDVLRKLTHDNHAQALTGPIKRRDTETVKKHLGLYLDNAEDERERKVYESLAEILVKIANLSEFKA